jgi:hypothetical protein
MNLLIPSTFLPILGIGLKSRLLIFLFFSVIDNFEILPIENKFYDELYFHLNK